MKKVCLVTGSLYPLDISESALGIWQRALEAKRAGHEVTVVYQEIWPRAKAALEAAVQLHAHHGLRIMFSPRTTELLPEDMIVPLQNHQAPSLILAHRLAKLHRKEQFDEIIVSAYRGLALSTLRARCAGLDFTDTRIILDIDHLATVALHLDGKLPASLAELGIEFCEYESLELAEDAFCTDSGLARFLEERLGWECAKVAIRPPGMECPPAASQPPHPSAPRRPAIIAHGASAFMLNEFIRLSSAMPARRAFLLVGTHRDSKALAARIGKLKVATALPPLASAAPDALSRYASFALPAAPWNSPVSRWLAHSGIPLLPPSTWLSSLPGNCSVPNEILFQPFHAGSLISAMQSAQKQSIPPTLAHALSSLLPSSANNTGGKETRRIQPGETLDTPITIAVSHYNLGPLLLETLDSLKAQTYPRQRVVVVDDGSTDEEALALFRDCQSAYPNFYFVELPHKGYWSPRNHVILSSPDPLIAVVDGDNLPTPDMTECFVRAMERSPGTDAFSCFITSFDHDRHAADGSLVFKATNFPLGSDVVSGLRYNAFGDTNSVFRTRAIRAIGGYRENFDNPYADWDIFLRLVSSGFRLGVIPKVLLHYRSHAASMIRRRNSFLCQLELLARHNPTAWKLSVPASRRLARALYALLG